MSKNKLWESVNIFQTGLSAAEWAWRIFTLLIIGGGGTITGLLAKADPLLKQLGSIYWVLIGLLTSFIIALVFFLFKSAVLKQAQAEFTTAMTIPPNSINPLLDNFVDVVIPVEDLRLPMLQLHKNKHFKRCKFVGPAAIAIMGGNYLDSGFHECGDIIALPDRVFLTGIVVLENCTVENCEFIRTTIFTDQNTAKGFATAIDGIQVKGINA